MATAACKRSRQRQYQLLRGGEAPAAQQMRRERVVEHPFGRHEYCQKRQYRSEADHFRQCTYDDEPHDHRKLTPAASA